MNEDITHVVLSSRECAVLTPERNKIEALQSLFLLKNLPAEQLR